MAKLVGKRYALALFEAGIDLNKTTIFDQELDYLKSIFNEEPKLLQIFNHPKISKKEKHSLINELFKDRISTEMVNFLYVLIDKRREAHILEIMDSYKELFNEHKNIVRVVAVTAVPMEEKSKSKLIAMLTNKLDKKIELTNTIDNKILGGVLLKVENKLIDGTVKGQLEAIGKAISGATN